MRQTYDTADYLEPDHYHHDLAELRRIFALDSVDLDLFEELEADIEVEDGGNSNWAKETHEDGLSLLFDLVDQPMHSEH